MKRRVPLLSLALLAVVTPAAGQEAYDYGANCQSWPAVQGPHAVGTAEFEVTDRRRSSDYAPVPMNYRRLFARAWYPASETDGLTPRPYFKPAEVTALPALLLSGAYGWPPDALRNCVALATNSFEGAQPAEGSFPVVAFNHGYTSYPAQQTALFEHLAANGYVVLSVGHPYESGGIVYPTGDVVTMSPRIMQDLGAMAVGAEMFMVTFGDGLEVRLANLPKYLKSLRAGSLGQLSPVWQYDVYYILDALENRTAPANVAGVAEIIDFDRRAYMGMSYGGYVAGMLAQGDLRAKGVVHLDGGSWMAGLIDMDLRTPFLTLSTSATAAEQPFQMPTIPGMYEGPFDEGAPQPSDLAYEVLTRAGLREDGYRVGIPGVAHIAVSDLPEILQDPDAIPMMGKADALAGYTAAQNDLVLGFLDRHVKGKDGNYPDDVLQKHPSLFLRDMTEIRETALRMGR